MSLPTEAECLKFMSDSKNAINDPEHGTWFIGGVEYPLERALMLAEYCVLIGSPLTSIATVEGALNQARRVKTLEDELAQLRQDFGLVFDALMGARWFSRALRRLKESRG